MAESFRIDFNTNAIEAKLDDIAKKAEKFVRPAAQAGANVIYQEAKYRAPVIDDEFTQDGGHWFYGTEAKKLPRGQKRAAAYFFPKGNLRDSIYQAYSKDKSGKGLAMYHVAWNHQKAPYGFMVERGTSRAAANPFLRPAYEAAGNLAVTVANDTFCSLMESAVEGVSR